jgi:hypothetical protein
MEFAQGALLKARMKLHLVERRRHTGRVDDRAQIVGTEVRDADRLRSPLFAQPDERLPRLHIVAERGHRPVDQVQIDIIAAEPFEAPVECPQRRIEAMSLRHSLVVTKMSSCPPRPSATPVSLP